MLTLGTFNGHQVNHSVGFNQMTRQELQLFNQVLQHWTMIKAG